MFKDKWSYYHFFGPLGLMLLFFVLPEGILLAILLIIVVTAPVWWEIWDQYKVKDGSPESAEWNKTEKALFTSEGKFDADDMKIGLLGVAIAFGLLWLYSIVF